MHLFLPQAPGTLIVFPFQACLVHTSETIRVCYFLERLMERQRPVMLVGTAGTGKSVLVGAKLASLSAEEYLVKNVPFNYYTTSAMLQGKGPRGHGGEGGVSECLGHLTWSWSRGEAPTWFDVPRAQHCASPLTFSFSLLLSRLQHLCPTSPAPLALPPFPILSPYFPPWTAGSSRAGSSTQSRSAP